MSNETKEVFEPTIDPSSTTVQEMFGSILNEKIQAGALEIAISKKVDSLIEETADDVFRSYSDLGKALKEKMTNAIMPQLENLDDLPTYHDFVLNRLKVAAQGFYDSRLTEVLDKEFAEILAEVPENITLSYIVNSLLEEAQEDNEPEGSITLIINDSNYSWNKPGDSLTVYIDKEADQSEHNCSFDLHLSKDKETGKYDILSIKIDDKKPGEALSMGRLYRMEKILFNVYAMKGRIELDQGLDADDYETGWDHY
ncbi:hypothetical protein FQP85_22115 [Pseudoalteromonas neustonica]|uniref:DUF4393 domain-containing protein n=1 Tax=Pseudoalteromonas neustonica TaxID=1840331 RepID=A0ABY3F896_9GAMM|nr:hypothetical protein [Pseudoalteromonas neustonica]TVU79890.1 hypothetical protein FQP85_22115 [Pseudoalteromonas neustonica]